MRSDIVPGGLFPDYELRDHGGTKRKLSELQGADPMVLVLSRGAFCPKDREQHRLLVQMEPELKVAYTKIVTVSTDAMMEANEMRDGLGAHWPFLIDPERAVQRDLDIAEYTDPYHNPMIPHTFVLEPGLVIYSVYNGYWYWGRPSPTQLRADLRAVTEKIRPDWDITAPGQRDAWERGDKSAFWPYGMSLREVFAADASAD
jgi:peroxiredoxin